MPMFLFLILSLAGATVASALQPGRYVISSERRFEEANKHVHRGFFLTIRPDGSPILEVPAYEPYLAPTAVVEEVKLYESGIEGSFVLTARFTEDRDKDKAVMHVLTLSFDDGYGAGLEAVVGSGGFPLNVVISRLPEPK